MLKKSCLALALCALGVTASQAAIVSIGYASNLGGLNLTGTFNWDTAAVGNIGGGGSMALYPVSSVSLFINSLDYSAHVSNPRITMIEFPDATDRFGVLVDIASIPVLPPFANSLSFNFRDTEGGIFNGVNSLPGGVSAFDGAELKAVVLRQGNTLLGEGNLTVFDPVVSSVPEPGSLLLVVASGLALCAARRRPAAV